MAGFHEDISEFEPFTEGLQPLRRTYSLFGPVPDDGYALRRVAHEHWGKGFHIIRHLTNRVFLGFVDSGFADCIENGQAYRIQPQHVLCMRPERPIEIICREEAPLCMHIVTLDTDNMLPECLAGPPPVIRIGNPGDISRVLTHMFDLVSTDSGANEQLLNHYLQVLLDLIGVGMAQAACESGPQALLNRCREFLLEHAGESVNFRELAREMGVSQAYICRLFRQYEKRTAQQFHHEARMRLVAEQLIRTDRTLDDLAIDFEISSAFALSRMFKKQFGLSPKAFRDIERREGF